MAAAAEAARVAAPKPLFKTDVPDFIHEMVSTLILPRPPSLPSPPLPVYSYLGHPEGVTNVRLFQEYSQVVVLDQTLWLATLQDRTRGVPPTLAAS